MRVYWVAAGVVVGYVIGKSTSTRTGGGLLKAVIRRGLLAGRAIESTVAELREELSDAIAEAKADADAQAAAADKIPPAKA